MDELEATAEASPIGAGRTARSRAGHVYDQLHDWIRSGRLPPGTRVREEEIARTLAVSRTPVREALSRLQTRGLVEQSNGGLSVVELTRPQTMELYAMRGVLEGAAARFAAENASPSDVATINHAAQQFARHSGDASGFAKVNMTFHEAIYEAAHNRYLMRMLADLNDSLTLLPGTTFAVPRRSELALGEHELIRRAIEARDADAAERAARDHIRNAMQARLELMFSM